MPFSDDLEDIEEKMSKAYSAKACPNCQGVMDNLCDELHTIWSCQDCDYTTIEEAL